MVSDTYINEPHLPFGKFLVLSLIIHLAGLALFFAIPRSRTARMPEYYTVRLAELPRSEAELPGTKEAVKAPPVPPAKIVAPPPRVVPAKPAREKAKAVPEAKAEKPAPLLEKKAEAEAPGAAEPSAGAPEVPGAEAPAPPGVRSEGAAPTLPVPGQPAPALPEEKLFDREVIQEFAKAEKPEAPGKESITFSTEELKYKNYMRRLKETIEGIWVYPPGAAEKGIYGDLLIEFVIKKDGTLGSVRVERTSGHSDLDRAALKALREAQPYWPLPEGWGVEALNVRGHFIYSLYGLAIR